MVKSSFTNSFQAVFAVQGFLFSKLPNPPTKKIKIIIIWQSKSERSDWFFLGQDFAIRTVSMEMVISCVFFVFESRQIQSKHGLPHNKLLTNLASSSRPGEYWPLVVFVRTSLCLVRTAMISGQYSQYSPRAWLVRG